MRFSVLGKTGLKVSVLGLGCGGPSRLGFGLGADERKASALIDTALELGINVIDTAAVYGNESAVGNALKQRRKRVVLSSKILVSKQLRQLDPASIINRGYRAANARLGHYISAKELRLSLEQSLRRLHTDYLDILYLHAITPKQYPHCVNELLPTLDQLRAEGKVRHIGISETMTDSRHQMLSKAVADNAWDVIMLRFSQSHLSARSALLPSARKNAIGVVVMAAARHLGTSVKRNTGAGGRSGTQMPQSARSDYTYDDGSSNDHVEAYRFCLQEPGVNVVLTGTGNLEHLRNSVRVCS